MRSKLLIFALFAGYMLYGAGCHGAGRRSSTRVSSGEPATRDRETGAERQQRAKAVAQHAGEQRLANGKRAVVAERVRGRDAPNTLGDIDRPDRTKAELERCGITLVGLEWALQNGWAVSVVKISAVQVEHSLWGDRLINYHFVPLKVYSAGYYPGWNRKLLPAPSFRHEPGHRRSMVKEALRAERAYLVLLKPHELGKWPILERCIEVPGLDASVVKQVERWLSQLSHGPLEERPGRVGSE